MRSSRSDTLAAAQQVRAAGWALVVIRKVINLALSAAPLLCHGRLGTLTLSPRFELREVGADDVLSLWLRDLDVEVIRQDTLITGWWRVRAG